MRRDVKILLVTVAAGAIAQWGHIVPDTLSELDTFHVKQVRVSGTHYLGEDEVRSRLGLEDGASVWLDIEPLIERVRSHPLVEDVRIRRQVPDGLAVDIVERRPVALAPTPTLEPVDAYGHRLPIDPSLHRLDLPIIASERTPPAGSALFTEDVRVLAAEVAHLVSADTAFLQMVSGVRSGPSGVVVASWTEPRVDFLLPSMASPSRLREGLGALSTALARDPGTVPTEIDLRFADQVIVRREE